MRVDQVMTEQVSWCGTEDSLARAAQLMWDHDCGCLPVSKSRVRRLPVVDEQGSLVGMVSLADLARAAARESTKPKQAITETEVGDTLAAICEPAS